MEPVPPVATPLVCVQIKHNIYRNVGDSYSTRSLLSTA